MPDALKQLALQLGSQGPHKTLPTPRLIQLLFNGVYIIKTTSAVFVWEHPYYPQLYIPASDLHSYSAARSADLHITPGEAFTSPAGHLCATQWTIRVRDKSITPVLHFPDDLPAPARALRGLVKIDFDSIDQWFEESAPILIHPKDPFKRVDTVLSTRHIVVTVAGRVVADTDTSVHLYETGLPSRFYLPRTRVDASVLRRSDTRTRCPHKGEAEYYHVEIEGHGVVEDVAWYYDRPLWEAARVEGLVCFYHEKVTIEVDGEVLECPVSPFGGKAAGEKPDGLEMGSLSSPLVAVVKEKGEEEEKKEEKAWET